MVMLGVGVGEVSLAVNVDMSWTIYYSHYLIVMTQMMVGNYRAQMPPYHPSASALVITIKDGLVRGESRPAGISSSKTETETETQTPPAR